MKLHGKNDTNNNKEVQVPPAEPHLQQNNLESDITKIRSQTITLTSDHENSLHPVPW